MARVVPAVAYEDRGTCDKTPAKNMEDGADERSGKNAQNQELIEWFMNDIDNPSGQAIRNEFADKSEADEPQDTTGGQVLAPDLKLIMQGADIPWWVQGWSYILVDV